MTEAMPFLQKAILLSYDPRPLAGGCFLLAVLGQVAGAAVTSELAACTFLRMIK